MSEQKKRNVIGPSSRRRLVLIYYGVLQSYFKQCLIRFEWLVISLINLQCTSTASDSHAHP